MYQLFEKKSWLVGWLVGAPVAQWVKRWPTDQRKPKTS